MAEQAQLYLAALLMKEYGYQKVEVQHLKDEIWLSHNGKKEYNLIRLYLAGQSKLSQAHTSQILEAIKSVFHQKLSFLEIELSDEKQEIKESTLSTLIQVSPLNIPESLLTVFPKCAQMFEPIDEKELEKLKGQINKKVTVNQPKNFLEFIRNLPKGTLILSIVLIILTLVVNGFALLGYDLFVSSIFFGAYYKTLINAHFEIYRFLSYGFIHTDFFHLAMNVFALVNLGNFMERIYGAQKFVLTIILGIIMGGLFVYIANGNELVVGISAGLYAILGVLFVYLYETGLIRQPLIQAQVWRMVMINVLINFLPQVSMVGHVGGLIAGLFLGFIFSKTAKLEHLRKHSMIALAILFVSLSALCFRSTNNNPLYVKTDLWLVQMADDLGLSWYAEDLSVSLYNYYAEVSQ